MVDQTGQTADLSVNLVTWEGQIPLFLMFWTPTTPPSTEGVKIDDFHVWEDHTTEKNEENDRLTPPD